MENAVAEEESSDNAEDIVDMNKRKKVYFNPAFDIKLIRAVINENPYDQAKDRTASWATIAAAIDQECGTEGLLPRTCRDRTERLLAYFEQDHPFLKGTDSSGEKQQRLSYLEDLSNLRKTWSKTADGTTPPGRKIRLHGGNPPRRLVPRTLSAGSNTAAAYSTPGSAGGNGAGTADERTTYWVAGGLPDGAANPSGNSSVVMPHGRPVKINPDTDGYTFVPLVNGGLDSEERSLVKELLEARKQEDVRRREEIELRREELVVQKLKLELEKAQWEADRKERQARLEVEEQERKIVLEFMRKTLFPNTSNS